MTVGCSGANPHSNTLPRQPASDAASPTRSAGHVATKIHPRLAAAVSGWEPITRDQRGVVMDRRAIYVGARTPVVVVRLRAGQTSLALHAGNADPSRQAYRFGVINRSTVTTKERPHLVAAFTGGFALTSGSGGYVQERHVVAPPKPGFASLVIDANGAAHVGVWGHGVPAPGEQVFSVRQNLAPLVLNGRPSARIGNLLAWGATLGGGAAVARTALGQDSAGNLLFAGSMSVTPTELADALVRAGARIAMQLDINPEWVQFDYAHRPGGPLIAGIPGQHRPADQYLVGWGRDFIAVLAPPFTSAQG